MGKRSHIRGVATFMITGLIIAATAIGVGTWLRWVSRPPMISIRYVLDLRQTPPRPAPSPGRPQGTAQGRLLVTR
jgi:hypothetical protein